MNAVISEPRPELSPFAPRLLRLQIPVSKIGLVIGPGGKTIREIEKTGATINVEDDGMITVASVEAEAGNQALAMIRALVEDAEIGKIYEGRVKSIKDFGAFIEILPGKEGLCHISELEHRRVARVEDVLADGDIVRVKVIGIDDAGKIKLSRKATLEGGPPEGEAEDDGRPRERRERGDGDRGRRPPPRRR
jgi:polyribonucleotide nucleotidyltransferase